MPALFRIFVVSLSVVTAGGPALLDGCLVNCHADTSRDAVGSTHCHQPAVESDALRIESAAHCDHDHDQILGDATEVRLGLQKSIAITIISLAPKPATPSISRPFFLDLTTGRRVHPIVALTPLRI